MQVFEGATNRTAVFVCQKQQSTFSYPVPYLMWRGASRVGQDEELADVLRATEIITLGATPVEQGKPTSPWLTAPKEVLKGLQKVLGQSDYSAFAGCCTWLNGIYWVEVQDRIRGGNLLIRNLHDVGKIKIEPVQTSIEPELIYPLLRGRDVTRWSAEPSAYIILTQEAETRNGIAEAEMKRKYPKTYSYFKQFEKKLRGRSGYKKYFNPDDPFYSIYNVGTYTLAPYKVVWREQSREFQAAKISLQDERPIIPDHKLMAIACYSEEEADYLAALLGSSPCKLIVKSYAISTSTSTHVL